MISLAPDELKVAEEGNCQGMKYQAEKWERKAIRPVQLFFSGRSIRLFLIVRSAPLFRHSS